MLKLSKIIMLVMICACFGVEHSHGEPETVAIFVVDKNEVVMKEKISKSDEEWRRILSPQSYSITRRKGTERPFSGEYHDSKAEGIYQCIACGTDLFSSQTKFDSGTGWPSFWEPVASENVSLVPDRGLFMVRTEVVCARCGAHLGHVFDDGPAPTHKRYCINSGALQFVPADQ